VTRANYIGAPEMFNLNQACHALVAAFGPHLYLVGSSLERRDFRDVDVRCILPDDEFDRLFPGAYPCNYALTALWSVMCSSISLWLSQQSGLKIDFQIQRMTQANEEEPGTRAALGLFLAREQRAVEEDADGR
jgi:hypothetical protein